MPTKTPCLNISVLLLHNCVKESQTRAFYFQIYSLIFRWIIYARNSGNFPFQTMPTDHKTASSKITSCLFKIIMRAKCVLITLEWNCHEHFVKKTKTKYLVKSRSPRNFKTGNLKLLIGRERPRNILPRKCTFKVFKTACFPT